MRLPKRVEVLVVGSGPAGAATALRLARAGREVLLVDRVGFPRAKVCGDGLTPRAIASLASLGVWHRIYEKATPVHSLRTYDLTTGVTRSAPLPNADSRVSGLGAVVQRIELDEALRQAAVAAGARFVPNVDCRSVRSGEWSSTEVEVTVGGRASRVQAGTLIGADGANSRVARSVLGCLPGVVRGVAARQYWRVAAPAAFTICMPLSTDLEDITGYGWVFPVGTEMANVGVGIVGAETRLVRRIYDGFVRALREQCAGWSTAVPLGPVEGGSLATGMRRDRVARGRVLLVGDAAGAVNPYSGEGIAQALEGAEVAADVIAHHPGGEGVGDVYWRELEARFPFSTRDTEWLSWLLARGAGFAREFWHAASRPTGILGTTARRMTLDELIQPTPSCQPGTMVLDRLAAVLAARRPILARIVRGLVAEVAPIVSAGVGALRAWRVCGSSPPVEVEQIVGLVSVMLAVVADVPTSVAPEHSIEVERVAEWSCDAAALGVVDLLLAETLGLLAALPGYWCGPVSEAVGELIARRTLEAAAGQDIVGVDESVRELVRDVETSLARDLACGTAVA